MIDALLAGLEREAEAEIARVLADGRAQAAALTAQAEERIARQRQAALGRRESEGRAAMERSLAGARHLARERTLQARANLLDRVFTALQAALPALAATAAYRATLARDLARTLAFAGEEKAVVHCAPALTTLMRRLVKANGGLRIKSDARIVAGFKVATADGGLEVDGTLEGRALRQRPRLALEALVALRGGE
jgi:vacuolar-type H+-ATPase subunit E/Vma4